MIIAAESFIVILIVYLLWYVQSFGNIIAVLYGSSIISVICILIHIINKREINIKDYPIGIKMPFVLVVYCIFTSFLFAENKNGALKATLTFLAYTLVCFVISYISQEKQSIDWIINIIIITTFISCFWATFFGTELSGYGKILGRYCNPHILGAEMNIGVFALAYKSGRDVGKSIISMILSIWPIFVIINCSSRKSMLAVFILLLFWSGLLIHHIFCHESNNMKVVSVLIIGLLALFIVLFYKNVYVYSNMAYRMSHFSEEESNTFRVLLYKNAITIFKEHPFFGVGIDGFKYVSLSKGMSHSTYAESIADFGFIGCIIYFIPIIHSLISAIYQFFACNYDYHIGLIIALIFSELFLGIGQVFFFEPIHFIIWTIIYCYLHIIRTQLPINNLVSGSKYKYLK